MKINVKVSSPIIILDSLSVGDTFKLPNAVEVNTRYIVVEHLRSVDKCPSRIRYVCLNNGIIYSSAKYEGKQVIQVDMVAEDVL